MLFYILIFIFLFVLTLIDTQPRISYFHRKRLFIFISIIFCILSFIRWETGTDWENYLSFFRDNHTLNDFQSKAFEPLFTYMNYLVKQLSNSYTIMLFFISLIIFPLKYSTIWKFSAFPFLSLLLFLLMFRCDIFFVRETIALAIAFYSIGFIINKKIVSFLVTIIIAMLFHSSIVVFVFAYWIYHMKITKTRLIYILILSIMLIVSSTTFMATIKTTVGGMIGWKIDSYMGYGADETFGTGLSVRTTMLRGSINRSFFLVMYLYTYIRYKQNDFVRGLVKLYITNFILFLITCPINVALTRICNSYEQVSVILISYYILAFGKRNRTPIVILLGVYFFIRFYMSTLTGGYSQEFIPYKSIMSL